VLFSLAASSMLGSIVGGTAIVLKKRDWSSRIPYGPYIALGAVIWIFGGYEWLRSILVLD
jgi:leader peptidase (prepilin peptidase)/N-methyltransferase